MHLGTVDTGTSQVTRAMMMLTANCNTAGTTFTGNNTLPFIEDAGNITKGVINNAGNVLKDILVWALTLSAGVAGDASSGQNTQIAIEEQTTVGSLYQRYLASIAVTIATNTDNNSDLSLDFPGLHIPAGHSLIYSWSGMVGVATILPLATVYYTVL